MSHAQSAGYHAHDDASVRPRILRGAAQAFGRLGYGATSVEAILEASGVSRRTFYKTFRSKEDVLRVLFENSVGMLLGAVTGAQGAGGSREARLDRAVEAYVRVHAEAGSLARVLLLEQFSPGSPLAQQRETAMATFSKLIADAMARDGAPAPDPILVRGVVAAINEIAVQMATEHPEGGWDVARAKNAMLRVLVALDERADPKRWPGGERSRS
jgi:AcrR family transcriptional regulator